jgi:Flp pilus assembly protein TadG
LITEGGHGRRRAWRHRRRDSGASIVEFAIVAPMAFLLLIGIVVFALLEMNEVQLSNMTREAARAAGVCGGVQRDANSQLPNGSVCSYSNLKTYVTNRLSALPSGSVSKPATGSFGSNCDKTATNAIVCVWTASHSAVAITSNALDACVKGDELEIITQFDQQLYVPLVSRFFGASGTTKSISADAYAECEQG